ncbi:MAG: Gfo/Idh/MocA family oxidoreductase [Clostridia bacterium]|nr:Gfo/Idh/MocA family oxidoreductase [Clostridia bacterium]
MGKEIGVCLIGCGRAGMIHARNFNGGVPGAHMEAVVDALPEAADAAARELAAGVKRHTDYREILADKAVDAVVVVAPTNLHRNIVVDCARAGKHIFCEKPMAMNVRECEEMIGACAQAGVALQIGFMRRHDASFVAAKEQVDAGVIGDITLIRSCTRGPSQPRPWMYDIQKSNGILAEVNSHDIDCARWFAGSDIATMHVTAGNYRSKEAAAQYPYYYDNVVLSGSFENSVLYCIDGAAYVRYGYDAQLEVLGTKGVIRVTRQEGNGVETVTEPAGIARPFVRSWVNLFKEAYLAEDIHFAECVANGATPCVTGRDGLMAVHAVERGNAMIVEQLDRARGK